MNELVMYRLKSAKERLDSAKILLEAGKYKDSIGRSYYAIFTAVRAVLAGLFSWAGEVNRGRWGKCRYDKTRLAAVYGQG